MMFVCRKWRQPETERTIDVDDPRYAPDEYAAQCLERGSRGCVTFVECRPKDEVGWSLWRVETLGTVRHQHGDGALRSIEEVLKRRSSRSTGPVTFTLALMTLEVTEADAISEYESRGECPPGVPA